MKQVQLLSQNICGALVTAIYGGVPVLKIDNDVKHNVIGAVNFLRSGCQAVQFLDYVYDSDFNRDYLSQLTDTFEHLTRPGEEFKISLEFPVITVSRKGK